MQGGTQTGANLFHSFEQFGVNQNQTANFISNPSIQNILGRVTGGDASLINGLIQVTGGNSNLYLMNPAGIIFGAGASLNVPAAFTATTANGIGFGDKWFNAVGTNNYASLLNNPNGFAFTQAGTIFNAGNLAVGAGQNLTLLGGTVINTGTISAPGGNITIAAIPGEQLVRITPEGSLLSLALPVETKAAINSPALTPLSLPQLLTGGNVGGATGVTVENGVVKLTGAGVTIPDTPGVAVVAHQVNVSGATGGRRISSYRLL
nr:filamentous hemagglutinin N-terminal domain-containing protein [Fortiea contorta]